MDLEDLLFFLVGPIERPKKKKNFCYLPEVCQWLHIVWIAIMCLKQHYILFVIARQQGNLESYLPSTHRRQFFHHIDETSWLDGIFSKLGLPFLLVINWSIIFHIAYHWIWRWRHDRIFLVNTEPLYISCKLMLIKMYLLDSLQLGP